MHPEFLLNAFFFYLFFCEIEKLICSCFNSKSYIRYLFQWHKFIFTFLENFKEYLRCPQIFTPFRACVFIPLSLKTFPQYLILFFWRNPQFIILVEIIVIEDCLKKQSELCREGFDTEGNKYTGS